MARDAGAAPASECRVEVGASAALKCAFLSFAVAGCASETPTDLGGRLTKECTSIVEAAMAVKLDARSEAQLKESKNELIFQCILARGRAVLPASDAAD